MEGFLKQSTQVTVTVLMIDSTDHVTGKTGLAAGITKYLTKAGGTPTAATMTTAELDATNAKGIYSLVFTTSHTDTLGEFQLHLTAAGADPTDLKWQVSTYLPGEAATLQADQAVNTTKIGGTTQTARDIGASVLLAASQHVIVDSGIVTTVTNQLTAAAIATGVWTDATAGDFTTALSVGKSVMNGVTLGTGLTVNALTTNNDKTGYALSATGSAALTEGYPTLGSTGTLAQLLYAILQHLEEASISGTTKTVKKRDQATTAETLTLNDATSPTSITRAT